jgi:BASS family bile acid:Na+ symporter
MYLEVASQVLVLIFVLSTLFSVGLLVSTRQVLAGVQQRRSLGMALCANFVVLPGAALALCLALQLTPPIQAAVLLVATAPGSPALLRLNEFARGDQARAVGLLVVLTSLTVVYQPLVLPMLLPGLDVSPMPIARALVLTVLLPLVLGLVLKARWPVLAGRLRPALARLGNISAVVSCFILLPIVYWDALMDVILDGGGVLVLLLYLPLAVGAGWCGNRTDHRRHPAHRRQAPKQLRMPLATVRSTVGWPAVTTGHSQAPSVHAARSPLPIRRPIRCGSPNVCRPGNSWPRNCRWRRRAR